ncbi:hypothetical protein MVEN_02180500 [Mycena venus]|uniref:Uncharacterized protein n=1 Tax=Mycena venus TaxID=2733690 RepID=A0A8H6X841_9AGAR|nr:hypothetical protein MVEN_02180200 [Mycena venus]KAF7336321.1 hypothetical protein MVEN_02180500 [Mycena venus]
MRELSDVVIIMALYGGETASNYKAMSIRDRNNYVTEMVRDSCTKEGYFAGWKLLTNVTVASACSLPSPLVSDVLKCVSTYDSIRAGPERCVSAGLRVTITLSPTRNSVHHIGPKSLGGKAWIDSNEYAVAAQRGWSVAGFASMSPCIVFIWLGVQRKTIPRKDLEVLDAFSLRGTVDYDCDRVEANRPGFVRAMELESTYVADVSTPLQAAALASKLNYDLQLYVRRVQERWVRDRKGATSLGPSDIPPADWIAANLADCASLGAFGYESSSSDYSESRAAMFGAMVVANCYDLLFDRLTSNRMSSVTYLAAARVTQYDAHTAFLITVTDRTASRASRLSGLALLGENALLVTAAWVPFNDRYRTWERFVKYTRQLRGSTDSSAQAVLKMSTRPQVLVLPDDTKIEDAWVKATTPGVQQSLIPRDTPVYKPSSAPEMSDLPQPDLCSACVHGFQHALHDWAADEIHGISGLPHIAFAGSAVARAAAIRRVAIFATDTSCCEGCASRIGCWADLVGYTVLTASMLGEEGLSASEWLLECYAVWTVTIWPVSVPTVLSGFDLLCDVSQEEGAMGGRDVLDC